MVVNNYGDFEIYCQFLFAFLVIINGLTVQCRVDGSTHGWDKEVGRGARKRGGDGSNRQFFIPESAALVQSAALVGTLRHLLCTGTCFGYHHYTFQISQMVAHSNRKARLRDLLPNWAPGGVLFRVAA